MWHLFGTRLSRQLMLDTTDDATPDDATPEPTEPSPETPAEPSDPNEGPDFNDPWGDGFHDGPDSYGGDRLESREDSLASRASGDFHSSSLEERACTAGDQSEAARGINESREKAIESLL